MNMDLEPICFKCVGDEILQAKIKKTGTRTECSLCGKTRKTMDIDQLANDVAVIFQDNFQIGSHVNVWDFDRDKISHTEQSGESLIFYIGEILQLDEDHETVLALQEKLVNPFPDDEGFFDSEAFERRTILALEAERGWNEFRTGIMHKSRFFNEKAKEFLRWLFEGIDSFKVAGFDKPDVVRWIRPEDGQPIFRGRNCTDPRTSLSILANPAMQLAAPPKEAASAGRMNPAGVPVFYGAFDRETCIAELRPPVDGRVISAEFKLSKEIRILDFKALEEAYDQKNISYFDPDYRLKIERREFLLSIHSIIRHPVVPDQEHEYLKTQVVAEYLSTQHNPPIDGVVFSSAQNPDGLNIVLFSHVISTDPLPLEVDENGWSLLEPISATPRIEFVPESLVVHHMKEVKYKWDDLSVYGETIMELTDKDYRDWEVL